MTHVEAQLESIRCKRAALETRRAGYDALNACRASSNSPPAYGSGLFFEAGERLELLAQEAARLAKELAQAAVEAR